MHTCIHTKFIPCAGCDWLGRLFPRDWLTQSNVRVQSTGDAGHSITGFINNAHTAVRRRINNIVTDERTHSIFEMVLGLPAKASTGLTADTYNQGVSYELAAEAQLLPIADDEDSDDDDVINKMPWPALLSPSSPPRVLVQASEVDSAFERPIVCSSPTPFEAPSSATPADDLMVLHLELDDSFAPSYATHMQSLPSSRGPVSSLVAEQHVSTEPSDSAHDAATPVQSAQVQDLLSFSPVHLDVGEPGEQNGAAVVDPFSGLEYNQEEQAANAGTKSSDPGETTQGRALLDDADPQLLADPLGALPETAGVASSAAALHEMDIAQDNSWVEPFNGLL